MSAADASTLRLALVGNPNCGKTALFNQLTGSRQKVANYAGVTVERKEGRLHSADSGRSYAVLDLPGATVSERWTGTYASAADVVYKAQAAPGVVVGIVTGGTGASTSFAFAEELVQMALA